MPKQTKKDAKLAVLQVENWNLKYKVGTQVSLRMDNGTDKITRTRFEAYVCDAGYPVCFFEGVSGYYLLDRATPLEEGTVTDGN